MKRYAPLVLAGLLIVLAGASTQRSSGVSLNQIAPSNVFGVDVLTTTAATNTVINPGFLWTHISGTVYTAACSLAFTQDPALVAHTANWGSNPDRVIAAAADTILAGSPASPHPYAGTAKIDTTFFYVPANGTFSFDVRASQLKVKGTGNGSIEIQTQANDAH